MVMSSLNVSCLQPTELNANITREPVIIFRSYLSFKVQHQCHLLPEASFIPQPERPSVLQTSQSSLHIMGIYVHILSTFPTKLYAFGKQNLLLYIVFHAPKTAPACARCEINFCSKCVLGI